MTSQEIQQVVGGFCRADAAISGTSGVVATVTGPHLAGLAKVTGAGVLVWAGSAPDRHRLQIASAVSAGLAALDLILLLRPRSGSRGGASRRVLALGGAVYHAFFAKLHREAARDLS